MDFISKSVEDTKKFAKDFLEKVIAPPVRLSVVGQAAGGAMVVGLYGNLGSGKTTFVQCVAEILGVKENITSPTFLIFKKYQLPVTSSRYQFLVHVDVYRLKSGEELQKLRFEELLHNPANLILIEWADLVADILPKDHIKLKFEFVDETIRKIDFHL